MTPVSQSPNGEAVHTKKILLGIRDDWIYFTLPSSKNPQSKIDTLQLDFQMTSFKKAPFSSKKQRKFINTSLFVDFHRLQKNDELEWLEKSNAIYRRDGHTYHRVQPEDFVLIRSLGEGAFGYVDAVRHKPSGTELAIKVKHIKRLCLPNSDELFFCRN